MTNHLDQWRLMYGIDPPLPRCKLSSCTTGPDNYVFMLTGQFLPPSYSDLHQQIVLLQRFLVYLRVQVHTPTLVLSSPGREQVRCFFSDSYLKSKPVFSPPVFQSRYCFRTMTLPYIASSTCKLYGQLETLISDRLSFY